MVFSQVLSNMVDCCLILVCVFLCVFVIGFIGVLLGFYFAWRGFDVCQIGIVIGVGLCGVVMLALFVMYLGDCFGWWWVLMLFVFFVVVGGIVLLFISYFVVVCVQWY